MYLLGFWPGLILRHSEPVSVSTTGSQLIESVWRLIGNLEQVQKIPGTAGQLAHPRRHRRGGGCPFFILQ